MSINILISYRFVGKILLWIQIVRNGKAILESEKYHTGSGATQSNLEFEKNNAFLRELRPGDRIRFIAGLPVGVLSKSINCTFQVSLQLKDYTYGKPLYLTEQSEFISQQEGKIYAEFKNLDIFLEFPDVANCLPRLDSLSLLCLPNNPVAGDMWYPFLIISPILAGRGGKGGACLTL